jgi:CheY-like chemotaxis protein
VLIVEDADATRALIELVLHRYGGTIEGCADGRSGLHRAQTWLPDLVILDIALPGMDGWAVLEAMRSDPATASIPVVITTAHAAPELRERARRQGAAAVICKPFAPAEMRAVVEPLLPEGIRV